MNSPRDSHDAESTLGGDFMFGDDATHPGGREVIAREDLMIRLGALIQTCEGCENVSVVEVTKLDNPDKDGCNWATAVVLEAPGVAPEVYGLAYAQMIVTARESWNLR